MYSESHCHLRGIIEEAIKKARGAGVVLILTAGIDVQSSRGVVETASKYSMVKGCVGIHPWRADEYNLEAKNVLEELASHTEVVAISEIGLDYQGRRTPEGMFTEEYIDPSIQKKAFIEQIHLAKKLGFPVLVHDRTPDEDLVDILEEESISEIGAAIHGFSKRWDIAQRCIEMGVYLSIGKRSIESNDETLMNVIRKVPLELLLTETDSNDPTGVLVVARKIAEIKGLRVEEVGQATIQNLRRLIKA